jgi:hypothetical protein
MAATKLPDLAVATFAKDQAKGLQDAAELVVNPNTHRDQLVPSYQQRLTLVRGQARPAKTSHGSGRGGLALQPGLVR